MGTFKLITTAQGEESTGGAVTAREIQRRARLGDFPPGVIVRIGRKVYLAEDKWFAFLDGGGATLRGPGGWRRPAETVAGAEGAA